MARINIKDGNLRKLKAIQYIVREEDGQEISLDEALARVLAFYRRFVPYN